MVTRTRAAVASNDVRRLLDSLPAGERRLVDAVRAAVLATVPNVHESVLWRGLSYHRPAVGGRVKGAVCQITAKRGEVRLEFIHGIRLPDPAGLLQGSALSKRFVPIGRIADVQRPGIVALLRAAAALEWR